MRGEILQKALEILADHAMSQVDFFEAVIASGYGASMQKLDYEYSKRQKIRNQNKLSKQDVDMRRRRLKLFMYKMKHDKLIDTTDGNIKILDKGKLKILELKNKLPGRDYQKRKQENFVILSFDIPERLRRNRDWLREVIRNLGFKMIHQSVWIGKIRIPEALIYDLESMKILEFVEIFEVSKEGSLRKFVN